MTVCGINKGIKHFKMAAIAAFRCLFRSYKQHKLLKFSPCSSLLQDKPVLSSLQFQCCGIRNKHWLLKFRRLRGKKILKVELPDYDEFRKEQQMTPEEKRSKLKAKGIAPSRPYIERPMIISCTGNVFEPYVPPEGDGKLSPLSTEGAKQKLELVGKKSKSLLALRKIRTFDEDFESAVFAEKAQSIFIEAHEALMKKDDNKLHDLVTEKCYPEMTDGLELKTIRWQYLESLDPPRVVHVRFTDLITKDNIFAQVTVRIHSKQTLAVYDRFGRLMYGSEVMPKNVLNYVVFEKHLSDEYGLWRIHGKVIPSWTPAKEAILKTFRKPNLQPEPPPADLPDKNIVPVQ